MKTIPLTKGQVALVDDQDYEALAKHKWHALRPSKNGCYYAARRDGADYIYMHRQITGAVVGQKVDHIDGNGLLNARSNLRFATQVQNAANQIRLMATNTSGFRGVAPYKAGNCWQATISVNGKSRYLGHFVDPVEAAKAYDRAALSVHGEFARPNFAEQVA